MFTFRHPAIVTLTPAPIREGKSYVALTGKSLGTPDLESQSVAMWKESLKITNYSKKLLREEPPLKDDALCCEDAITL